MIDTITRKPQITEIIQKVMSDHADINSICEHLHTELLNKKVKFPLLEYCAEELYHGISKDKHLSLCDCIEPLKTIGGNVIIGKILQLRLEEDYTTSIDKATHYISLADDWYVTDIIGERVYGVALLNRPYDTLKKLKTIATHKSKWVVRSIGPGVHYAIKKGLDYTNVCKAFELLLSLADSKEYHVKTGIGWAAKTTAKFHPEIIEQYKKQVENEETGQWFRGKIKIGLQRHQYAKVQRG